MTSYPAMKRWLAAALTLGLIGVALYLVSRTSNVPNPVDPNPAAAQGVKGGQDWFMYGGTPKRNMVNTTVKDLPAEWNPKTEELVAKNIKWVADLGSKAYGGPIIAGGRVFIGTNNEKPREKKWDYIDPKTNKLVDLGVMMAFDEAKGDFLWQSVYEKLEGGLVVDWPREGICSSPYIEDDRMYYVSNRCEVVCASVKDGKKFHWKLDMIKELGVFPHNISSCSPLLVGKHLWVVTSNGVDGDHLNVPRPGAPSFIKVDKANGKVLWQDRSPTEALLAAPKGDAAQKDFFKQLVNRGQLIQHGQWSNASYDVINGQPQVVFPGGDGWLYAFDPTAPDPAGKLLWKFDCNPKDSKYELLGRGTRSDFIASPVIYKDRVYIAVGQDPEHLTGVGHLWCIDMTKRGDVSPELVTDATVFPPKTEKNPNSAAVWHYGGETNAADRKELQRNYYFGRTMSTCCIHEDILYITELSGLFHCLDANTGKVHWTFDTDAETWSSPYYADGKVYVGNDSKTVYVFEHGTKLKKLAENEMGGRIRATPVAANGVLYVMTENKLYAIKK